MSAQCPHNVRTISAQCPHYVRTTSHEGNMSTHVRTMSAQCPHNVGKMSAQCPHYILLRFSALNKAMYFLVLPMTNISAPPLKSTKLRPRPAQHKPTHMLHIGDIEQKWRRNFWLLSSPPHAPCLLGDKRENN